MASALVRCGPLLPGASVRHCAAGGHVRRAALPQAPLGRSFGLHRDRAMNLQPGNLMKADILPPLARGAQGGGGGGGGGGFGGGGGGASGTPFGGNPKGARLSWLTYLFAAGLAAGGISAYVRKDSVESLQRAGGLALALAFCARMMTGGYGGLFIMISLWITGYVSYVMYNRYQSDRRVLPTGLIGGAAALLTLSYVGAFL